MWEHCSLFISVAAIEHSDQSILGKKRLILPAISGDSSFQQGSQGRNWGWSHPTHSQEQPETNVHMLFVCLLGDNLISPFINGMDTFSREWYCPQWTMSSHTNQTVYDNPPQPCSDASPVSTISHWGSVPRWFYTESSWSS